MTRLLMILALIWGTAAQAETIRMAVTTSFHNSGLSDVLLPAIKEDTGLELQLLVVGTGQALRLGEAGDVVSQRQRGNRDQKDHQQQGGDGAVSIDSGNSTRSPATAPEGRDQRERLGVMRVHPTVFLAVLR